MEAHQFEASGGGSRLKLLSLYASNFKKLKLKQPLFLSDGITLITGLNESGKSTILDAILYALYGRMIRPSQKPSDLEIISYGSGESQVRLEFAIGESKYRVVREVHKTRPNTAKLYELRPDRSSKTIATTVKDTTDEIERLMGGVTYNEIVASSVVAQKDLERLIKQRLDDRRKVVNVFLNLESFNKVHDEFDEEKARLEGTSRTPGQLTVERQSLESLTGEMNEYQEKQSQLSTLAEKADKLKTELRDFEKKFDETDRLYKTLNEFDEALDNQEALKKEIEGKRELEKNLEKQLSNISQLKTELGQVKRQRDEYTGLEAAEVALADSSKKLETLRESELRLDQLLERETQRQSEIEQKKSGLSTGTVSRPREPSKVWTYLAATGALGAGAVLSFFLTLVTVAVVLGSLAMVSVILLARQIASLSRAAEASQEEQKAHANRELVHSWEKELFDIKQESSDLKARVAQESRDLFVQVRSIPRYSTSLEQAESARDAVEQARALLESDKHSKSVLEERAKLLEKHLQQEPEIQEQLRATREEASRVAKKLAVIHLPTLPAGVAFSKDLVAEAAKFRDSLNESVSRVRTQIEETIHRQMEIKTYLEENKNISERVEAQKRKVRLLEKDAAVVKYSIRGLEEASESLRNRVKPQVERYMGLILPVITSGRYKAVELDDDYTVRVFDPEAGEFKPKEVFSGGTEDQMLLAMRLAFALALIPQAKGQSPEFLFLDEPLGSSDKVRREGILALLHEQLSQNFKQVFLISHVGEVDVEADTVVHMDNGTVREVVGRKPSLPQPVQLTA